MSTLTESEREGLIEAVQNGDEADYVERLIDERLAPVRALHRMSGDVTCVACDWSWPCPTIAALDGDVSNAVRPASDQT